MASIENISRGSPRVPIGLGSLEAQLMELLWHSGEFLRGQEILKNLQGRHNYKTVMTVLNRLVEKKLLERTLEGKAYLYRTVETRETFIRSIAEDLVGGYKKAYGSLGLQYLLDAAQTEMGGSIKDTEPAKQDWGDEDKPSQSSRIATLLTVVIGLEVLRIIFGRK